MSTKNNNKHQQEAFNEFDEAFDQRRINSKPTDEVIEAESLTAENEDKSKSFKAKKMDRALTALSANYLTDISIEKKFGPRVSINPGHMQVVWRDAFGLNNTDDVLEMSMNGIKFNCDSSDPAAITQLIFPLTGETLDISQAERQLHDGQIAIFRLIEFANASEGWMTWIEKLSRINEES